MISLRLKIGDYAEAGGMFGHGHRLTKFTDQRRADFAPG